jgi:ankyrin repeat protein
MQSLWAVVNFVTLLLAHGAAVDARSTDTTNTPLLIALRYGYTDVIPVLLAHGADSDARDNHGRTPLSLHIRLAEQRNWPNFWNWPKCCWSTVRMSMQLMLKDGHRYT